MTSSCKTCRFYVKHGTFSLYGNCHRYPPRVVVGHFDVDMSCDYPETEWPTVNENDFCGEFVLGEESNLK